MKFGMLTRSNSTLFYGYDPKYGLVRFGSTVKKICRNEIAKGIPVDLEWSQEFKSIPPSLVSASIVADGNWHRIYLHRRSKDTR